MQPIQYSWMSVIPLSDHLCSKSAQKRQLLLGTVVLLSDLLISLLTLVHCTEVGRAPLIHFQKIFLQKGFLQIKISQRTQTHSLDLNLNDQKMITLVSSPKQQLRIKMQYCVCTYYVVLSNWRLKEYISFHGIIYSELISLVTINYQRSYKFRYST